MPRLSAWFVRFALVYLVIGFTLGAVLLINKGFVFYPAAWRLLPIHIEVLLIGWFVQLAMGVAYWILPRLGDPAPRGSPRLVQGSFWLLNTGIALVILQAISPIPILLLLGRLVELSGVTLFVIGSWKRVKVFGT